MSGAIAIRHWWSLALIRFAPCARKVSGERIPAIDQLLARVAKEPLSPVASGNKSRIAPCEVHWVDRNSGSACCVAAGFAELLLGYLGPALRVAVKGKIKEAGSAQRCSERAWVQKEAIQVEHIKACWSEGESFQHRLAKIDLDRHVVMQEDRQRFLSLNKFFQ